MEDAYFAELFRWIVDQYELDPEVAAELLRNILAVLKNSVLQSDSEYEIIAEHLEREEMPCANLPES